MPFYFWLHQKPATSPVQIYALMVDAMLVDRIVATKHERILGFIHTFYEGILRLAHTFHEGMRKTRRETGEYGVCFCCVFFLLVSIWNGYIHEWAVNQYRISS